MRDLLTPVRGALLDADDYLGARVDVNQRRLREVDLEPLLAPFEHRPGTHPWIGEHLGKWLHAATLTWCDTGDPALAARMERAVSRLVATQEADGYLGTYAPGRRLGNYADADWDVWTHKYCMIGLVAYHEATGDERALVAAVRAADLLAATFGDQPGKRSIVAGAWHVGMAPTSVLEPVVQLYRLTGHERFLAFAEYILRAWDEPGGPRVRSTLLDSGRVSDVGNGKAYEMLSDLVGLLGLAKATGDVGHLAAVRAAWDDVVTNHLYVTGTASFGEHFHRPDELPDSVSVNMGETCVTVTWLQLTQQLFALTGEAQYADQMERTLLNHLMAAQRPDGAAWSYYTPLHGYREYDGDISCCVSSGPRGMASAPSSVLWRDNQEAELAVCLYTPATARVELPDGIVDLRIDTELPWAGGASITFRQPGPVQCALHLRRPPWSPDATADGVAAGTDGWIRLPARTYRAGDTVRVDLAAGPIRIQGRGWNEERMALAWGPLVLAHRWEPDPASAFDHAGQDDPPPPTADRPETSWRIENRLTGDHPAAVLPFSVAADNARSCRLWLPGTPPRHELSALHGTAEQQSSGDTRRASFNDYDPWSYAATSHDERGWFSLRTERPVTFSKVVYVHGRCLVHGGWFDASTGKPELQLLAVHDAQWTTVARIDDYPDTDAVHHRGLLAGARFEVTLPQPVEAMGLRVIGPGAWGDYPDRRFVTCALLQAF